MDQMELGANQDNLLVQNKYYQILIFVSCIFVYPAMAIYHNTIIKNVSDPYILTALVCGPTLIVNILSYKIKIVYRYLKFFFYIFVFLTILHVNYILFLNDAHFRYQVTLLVLNICIVNVVIEPQAKIVFAVLSNIVTLGFVFFYADNTIETLLATGDLITGNAMVLIFTYITVALYRKVENMLESEVKQKNNLKKWSSIGQMAGGIAHELNSPMGAVMLKVDMLKEKIKSKEADEKVQKDLETISNDLNRMTRILSSLRAMTMKAKDIDKDQVNIIRLIHDLKEENADLLKNSHTEFIFQFNIDSDGYVSGHQGALMQVFSNMLKNSIHAIEGLKEKWVKITLLEEKENYKILFQDCGQFLDKEIAEKIFDPFYSTKDIGKGMGIGLSLCQSLIMAHGGRIWLDTEYPNTTFMILLPKLTSNEGKNNHLAIF